MAIPGDFAPYVKATIASLKDDVGGLPAKIATYNDEDGHAYALDVPDPSAYYFGGDDTIANFPKVEVAIPTGRMRDFSLQQVDAEMDGDLVVAIWLEGETGEIPEMYEKCLGYARVATEVLVVPDACGPETAVDDIAYTFPPVPQGAYNAETRTFERWRTAAVLQLTINEPAHR